MKLLALGALAVALLAAGCEPGTASSCTGVAPTARHSAQDEALANVAVLRLTDLGAGWQPIRPEQPATALRPDLGDLVETASVDSAVFVRGGLVVRTTTTLFATAADAAVALDRARAQRYGQCLEGWTAADGVTMDDEDGAVIVRLLVPRASAEGNDYLSVEVLRRGRTVIVVQVVHGERPVGDLLRRLRTRLLARSV